MNLSIRLSTITWSIWFFICPDGDTQVFLWISLCGNVVLLTTIFLVIAKLTSLIERSNKVDDLWNEIEKSVKTAATEVLGFE